MNQFAIYERLPILLQNAVVRVYGTRLHRMRFGGVYQEQRRLVLQVETMPAEEVASYQRERLAAMIAEAAEHVPFYASHREALLDLARGMRDPSELSRLPLLEKSTVNADCAAFHSRSPGGRRIYGNTSGTTGRPLRILKTPESYQRNWAFYARSKELHGIRLGVRRATFGTRMVVPPRQRKPPFWRIEPAENNLYFSLFHLSERDLPTYIDELTRWEPEEVVCFPSALTVVAEAMIRQGVRLEGVRAVFCLAETLWDWQRDRIARAFGGRVVNLYGLAENVAWIYECPEGRLHIRPDYGYLELLPLEQGAAAGGPERSGGELGEEVREIVATGFLNRAMPLLRYRTRDQVVITPRDRERCGCGSAFPTVSRIIGRLDDNLIGADGRVQTRLDGVLKGIQGVRESQIEQIALDHLIVRIVPRERLEERSVQEIAARLQRIFGRAATIETREVEELPRTPAGKVRYQVNSIPRSTTGERQGANGGNDGADGAPSDPNRDTTATN